MKHEGELVLILPYAAWLALMMALPAASWSYAVRTLVTAALLIWSGVKGGQGRDERDQRDKSDGRLTCTEPTIGFCRDVHLTCTVLTGVLTGLAVFAIWVVPDAWPWYRRCCVFGDPYTGAAAVTGPLLWVQLFGSACVIPAAEELFFRKWLLGFAGFAWMVALFAVEHDRYLVGAIAGAIYGLLYLKRGLFAAILAHAVTNLALGLYVIHTGRWEFW